MKEQGYIRKGQKLEALRTGRNENRFYRCGGTGRKEDSIKLEVEEL